MPALACSTVYPRALTLACGTPLTHHLFYTGGAFDERHGISGLAPEIRFATLKLPSRKGESLGARSVVCPICKARECRRSRRRNLGDYALSLVGVLPWRCGTCQSRFHAHKIPFRLLLKAHCPRCGNPGLERIGSDRVEEGKMLALKRILGLPAYRCDPCRMKFYAVLPRDRSAGTTRARPVSKEA